MAFISLAILSVITAVLLPKIVPSPVLDHYDTGPKVGQLATDFVLADENGKLTRLSDCKGKNIIVCFFCGCQRCEAAAIKIAKLQKDRQIPDVLAVVMMDQNGCRDFKHRTKLRGVILSDQNGYVTSTYHSDTCPRIWLVDKNGKIIYRSESAIEGLTLNRTLYQVFELSSFG